MATPRTAGALFGFGILVLVIGLFLGPMATATTQDASTTVEVADGQNVDLNDRLSTEAAINATTENATITVIDEDTLSRKNTTELSVGDSDTVKLEGENVTVTYKSYTGDAVYSVDYPPTYGYADGPAKLFERLDLLLSFMGFLIAIGGLVLGVRQV